MLTLQHFQHQQQQHQHTRASAAEPPRAATT